MKVDTNIMNIPEFIGVIRVKKMRIKGLKPMGILIILLLLWCFVPGLLRDFDQTAGSVDQSIWLLVVLSLISFLLITALSWWLLQQFWLMMKLPSLKSMVLQFNTLSVCQQLSFYWGSFALLLLAALGCLSAIC